MLKKIEILLKEDRRREVKFKVYTFVNVLE